MRKSFVGLLSVVLLAALLGSTLSSSAVLNLSDSTRIENWLNESKLYERFAATVIEQSKEATTDKSALATSVTDSDAAVRHAAESAFPPQLLRHNARTFIDSNYAWLEGKTETPEFAIDLSEAKLNFAEQVGAYVRSYSATLPECTPAQLAVQQNQPVDPLTATCRPPGITPEVLGAETTQKLSTSGEFLSNPVITAQTLNPRDDKGGSQPYYKKLAKAPEMYQLGQKMPLLLGALAILSAIGIVFLSSQRRRGLRRVSIILLIAGVLLVATKFVADTVFNRLENQIFNASTEGQLEKSLTDFAHRVETTLVNTNFLFGLMLLALALLILGLLLKTRRKGGLTQISESARAERLAAMSDSNTPDSTPTPRSRRQPVSDITPGQRPKPNQETQPPSSKTSRPKPPRLIQ